MEKQMEKFLYYERIGLGKSEKTVESYRCDLIQFISYLKEYEGIEDFNGISRRSFRSFMAYMNKNGISKRSINRKISAIRVFLKYLLKHKVIDTDYSLYINSPKFEKNVPIILSKEEVNMIRGVIDLTKFNGIRDRAIIELLYSSGMRAQELLDINYNLINFDEREIRIIGKGEKERITFFSNSAKEWLLKYLSEKKRLFPNNDDTSFFLNAKGGSITDRSLRRNISEYAKKAGIEKDVSPHTFRHSFASYLLNEGVDIRYLQELLGHSSITTTQIYTHVGKKFLKEVYLKTHPFANEEK
ncbi:MAG: tyrosine recombinase XerC [Fusobacteria bacterium]|nr:tyrosine recombinase XerC [Fusobacteriota bacterium]